MAQQNNFDQFVDFLAHFSTELAAGTSPEYALATTFQHFSTQSPEELLYAVNEILNGTKSFQAAWTDLIKTYKQTRNSRLLELLGRFIEKGSIIGGERMLQVLKQVRKNSAMTKNRNNLIQGQKVKVTALSLISSTVIGMIAALAPILTLAFYNGFYTTPMPGSSGSISFQIFIALFLTVIVTGYGLNQTVGGSLRTVFLSLISFTSSYLLLSQLLLTLL